MKNGRPTRDLSSVLLYSVTDPAAELVLDRLADLLLDSDEVLTMLQAEDANHIRWMEPHIRRICEEIDELMKKLCD